MKIQSIDLFELRAPRKAAYWGSNYDRKEPKGGFFPDVTTSYPLRIRSKPLYTTELSAVLVKVTSDDGHIGWGESKAVVAPRAVVAILEDMVIPIVLGLNPLDIGMIKERMSGLMRLRGHLQGFYQEAISGIEIALWDLKGKAAGLPVYSLLGGSFRDCIPTYASGLVGLKPGFGSAEVEDLREDARRAVERGFGALKIAIGAGVNPDLKSVEVVRETVGEDYLLLVDAGGCYDFHTALRMADALEQSGIFWFEAPLPIDDFSGYVDLSKRVRIPITNDLVWTTGLVREMWQQGARVIFLPEVLKAGGILECKQIADLADCFKMPFAPHLSQGTVLQFAATAHLCAATPNFLICEYWWQDNPLGNGILREPLEVSEGCIRVPQGPGLGIEIEEEALRPFLVPRRN